MSFKLLGDAIAVKRIEKKEESLLIIPKAEEKIFLGEVFKIGPGFLRNDGKTQPMEVKPGDQIMYLPTTGFHVKDPYTDEDYTILFQKDIICILETDEEQVIPPEKPTPPPTRSIDESKSSNEK